MDRYLGLDVHAQSCTVVTVSASGKRLNQQVLDTNGPALLEAIRAVPGPKHLCIEEGMQSAWLYELLQEEVDELVVTIPEKHSGPKDDARDALHLAESLRTGTIKRRVYKEQGPYSELRAAVRSYMILRGDLGRAKTRLRMLYHSRGIQSPSDEISRPETHEQWEKQLPPAALRSAALLYTEIQALTELWSAAEKRLHSASKHHAIVKTLETAPAIGPIRAAQIVAVTVTPHRFRTKRQFWAYSGLAIVMRSSSDWVRDRRGKWIRSEVNQTRGLNRNRQPILKEVFKGAALQVATRMTSHPLHADYQRLLEGGMKPNLARLTIARRIAAAVLAMWKNQEAYDPAKHRSHIIAQA